MELMDGGKGGDVSRSASIKKNMLDDPYFQFREHFGLTLPILFNTWPSIQVGSIIYGLKEIENEKKASEKHKALLLWGDRARFLMPKMLRIAQSKNLPLSIRKSALNLFVRGGMRAGHFGAKLSKEEKKENERIETFNRFFLSLHASKDAGLDFINEKAEEASSWIGKYPEIYPETYSWKEKANIFFLETRFSRYFSRLVRLDFGALRLDPTKSVTSEVIKRLKYSFTLSIIPMIAAFALAQIFGMIMAMHENRFLDIGLNTFFLILYAIPVFVAAPFLIEKLALGKKFLFTDIPMPISGFQSDAIHYQKLTSIERLGDISLHLLLPLLSLLYLMIAMQAKIMRGAYLEGLRQDYVRTGLAKGLSMRIIIFKHVGRNAMITGVTTLASSIGLILTGSLIIETLFNIHGFGRFFYDAILIRDYNVILFSAIAGSFLTLMGYLAADIAYMLLDPRVKMTGAK